jgi:NOL1/NOP2/fmu family ribosome biogenesis protein
MKKEKRLKRIYNPTSISALSRYLKISTNTIHTWKRGNHIIIKGEPPIEHPHTIDKFNLIMVGWGKVCEEKLKNG